MAGKIGPEYQRLIAQIRASIASGEYPLGEAIPSTAALARLTGVSAPVVRRAVGQLEADGILEGHPGKGVFVKTMPEEADRERQDLAALGRQVSELAEANGRLEAAVIDLYGKMGYDYPHSGGQAITKTAGRRAQGQ